MIIIEWVIYPQANVTLGLDTLEEAREYNSSVHGGDTNDFE